MGTAIPESTFKRIDNNYIPKLISHLESKFITEFGQNCTCKDFPECGYIFDATIQTICALKKTCICVRKLSIVPPTSIKILFKIKQKMLIRTIFGWH